MSRVVYFVQDVETGLIKIGYSGNFPARLGALRVQAQGPLEVVFTCPGSFDLERRIHAFLAEHRRDGEWFEPNPEVFALIEQIKAGEEFDLIERQAVARNNAREAGREVWLRSTFSATILAAYGQDPGWSQRAANDAGVSTECVRGWVKQRALPNGASLINFGRANPIIRAWVHVSIAAAFISDRLDISAPDAAEFLAANPHLLTVILKGQSYDEAETELRRLAGKGAS